MTDDENQHPEMPAARRRMSQLALDLQRKFTPIDTVGLLCGAAVGVLITTFGREKTREYLAGLVEEMDADPQPGGRLN